VVAANTKSEPSKSARSGAVDCQHGAQMAHAAAKLSELQNCASTLPDLLLQRDFASGFDTFAIRFRKRPRAIRKTDL
jgi:hypothetical protein